MSTCTPCAQGNPVRRSTSGVWLHNLGNGERRGCPITSDYSRFTNLSQANTELRTALLKIATETEDPNAESDYEKSIGHAGGCRSQTGRSGMRTFTHDDVERIARIMHEVNRNFCAFNGDNSQKPWNEAEVWQKEASRSMAQKLIDNPNLSDSATHDEWMADKEKAGWVYGPVKDAEKKTHPCLVPFDELPADQKMKDVLVKAVALAYMSV